MEQYLDIRWLLLIFGLFMFVEVALYYSGKMLFKSKIANGILDVIKICFIFIVSVLSIVIFIT